MALITCSECGRQVSDLASVCPGCGAPVPTVDRQQPAMVVHASRPWPAWIIAAGAAVFLISAVLGFALFNANQTEWWASPRWSADDPALSSYVRPGIDILLINYTAQIGQSAVRSVTADHRGRVKVELNVTNAFLIQTPIAVGSPGGEAPAGAIAAWAFMSEDVSELAVIDVNGGLIEHYTRDNYQEKLEASLKAAQ